MRQNWSRVFFLYVTVVGFVICFIGFPSSIVLRLETEYYRFFSSILLYSSILLVLILTLKSLKPHIYSPIKDFFTDFQIFHLRESITIFFTFTLLVSTGVLVSLKTNYFTYISNTSSSIASLYLLFSTTLSILLAVITEEILFRGLLLRYTLKKVGILKATLINALVFTLLHGSIHFETLLMLIVSVTASASFCIIYLYTKRLYSVVTLHFAWNFNTYLYNFYDKVNISAIFIREDIQYLWGEDIAALIYITASLVFLLLLPHITKKNPTFIEPPRNA